MRSDNRASNVRSRPHAKSQRRGGYLAHTISNRRDGGCWYFDRLWLLEFLVGEIKFGPSGHARFYAGALAKILVQEEEDLQQYVHVVEDALDTPSLVIPSANSVVFDNDTHRAEHERKIRKEVIPRVRPRRRTVLD